MTAVFAQRPGFVASDGGPAAHFGNPLGEQRQLASGSAVVELGLGVVTVTARTACPGSTRSPRSC